MTRLWLLAWLLILAGCGSTPGPRPDRPAQPTWPERDGPGDRPPADLHLVPDAVPRIEATRSGGPNKPYVVLGQAYTPQQGDPVMRERGLASWYGRRFHGRPTSMGEIYDMYAMTAAHRTMPLPSYAWVRSLASGRVVVVRVNDRGPFHPERVIDLSYTAALKLGVLAAVSPVEVERITHEAIRVMQWLASAKGQHDGQGAALPGGALPSGPLPNELLLGSPRRWAALAPSTR